MERRRKKQSLKEEKKSPPRPYPYRIGRCKACGSQVVIQETSAGVVYCDPQRRLAILDYPKNDRLLPQDSDSICLLDERNGELVVGRKATSSEINRYKEEGSPGVPYIIGRTSHIVGCDLSWECLKKAKRIILEINFCSRRKSI